MKLIDILLEIQENQTTSDIIPSKIGKEIGEKMDDILNNQLTKHQQNEGILTITALTLALPGIINSMIKIPQAISKKYSGKYDISKKDPKVWYNVLEKYTEKIDSYIGKPFDIILKPIIKDNIKRKKVVNVLKALSIISISIAGSVDISKVENLTSYIKSLNLGNLSDDLITLSSKTVSDVITWAKQTIPTLLK